MRATRRVILRQGGIDRANTYTKLHFAYFGQYPWTRVPAVPPEMVFLPETGPISIYDMSSWSRTIFVPLSIIYAAKPVVFLPPGRGAGELAAGANAVAAASSMDPPPGPWTRVVRRPRRPSGRGPRGRGTRTAAAPGRPSG